MRFISTVDALTFSAVVVLLMLVVFVIMRPPTRRIL
jgi:hypothetical protein